MDAADGDLLAPPPAVTHLRGEAAAAMQRSLSGDIREERQDLREAAEQTLNVILDLSLEGVIRWVSPSWTDVIGTSAQAVQGRPIEELLLGEKRDAFQLAVESMQKDASRSQIIRFSLELGPASKLLLERGEDDGGRGRVDEEDELHETVDLEGQGIMVYDRSSGEESHVSAPISNSTADY
jgi:serine/threonine-protein kinase RIM15